MIDGTSLAAMRPKFEGIQTTPRPQRIKRIQIGIDVVDPVGVGWVAFLVPVPGQCLQRRSTKLLVQGLIVDRIEAYDLEEGLVEEGIEGRINGHLKERSEYVVECLLEVINEPTLLVNRIEPRNLDHPAYLTGVQLILDDPLAQLMPFLLTLSIDGESPLASNEFSLLQLLNEF
jgi:hypothetical protein